MRVPLEWLHEYVKPDLDVHALAERLDMTGTAVERVERHGVTALENFVIGRVLEAEQHPNADRLRVCVVDIGDKAPSQIVCGAPNVAAGQTVAVAKPGRRDARRHQARPGQAPRDRVQRDDPGRGRGRDRHRPRRDHGARARRPGAGDTARDGAPDRHRRARARDHAQPARLPRDLRRGARGARRHRSAARAGALERGPGHAGSARRRHHPGRLPRSLPALHRPRVRRREDRPEPAVAEGAADGLRPAADLERRRHHQLRDAAHRPAAARVRPGSGRGRSAHGASRRRGGADRDPRRSDPHAGLRHGADRGRRRARPRSPGSWAAPAARCTTAPRAY